MFPPMTYSCFIPPIESKRKRRGHRDRRRSTPSTRVNSHSSDARPARSRATMTNGSPSTRPPDQASSPAVFASLPSHMLPHGHSKPDPSSSESNNGKASGRVAMSKSTPGAGQPSSPKKVHGKEAVSKKSHDTADASSSKSKSTPESKPSHRRWSIWS